MPAHFITDPEFLDISEGGTTQKLRLVGVLKVWSEVLQAVVEVPSGFEFEESIPVALYSIARPRGESKRAAGVHDWLYRTGGMLGPNLPRTVTRKQADAVYHELLLLKGTNPVRAWVRWASVRVGGRGHWQS